MVSEFTTKTVVRDTTPNYSLNGLKFWWIKGTAAINSDYFTLNECSTVIGACLVASDGTIGTYTFATNVVTVTNAGALTWTGFIWGSVDGAH